jgi:hypothetical protein
MQEKRDIVVFVCPPILLALLFSLALHKMKEKKIWVWELSELERVVVEEEKSRRCDCGGVQRLDSGWTTGVRALEEEWLISILGKMLRLCRYGV